MKNYIIAEHLLDKIWKGHQKLKHQKLKIYYLLGSARFTGVGWNMEISEITIGWFEKNRVLNF
jgi:hypothetical protein